MKKIKIILKTGNVLQIDHNSDNWKALRGGYTVVDETYYIPASSVSYAEVVEDTDNELSKVIKFINDMQGVNLPKDVDTIIKDYRTGRISYVDAITQVKAYYSEGE